MRNYFLIALKGAERELRGTLSDRKDIFVRGRKISCDKDYTFGTASLFTECYQKFLHDSIFLRYVHFSGKVHEVRSIFSVRELMDKVTNLIL